MNQEEKSMGMWQKLFLGGGFSGPRLCLSVGAGAATTASFANTHTGRGCFLPPQPIPAGGVLPSALFNVFSPGVGAFLDGQDAEPNVIANFNGHVAMGYTLGAATDNRGNQYAVITDIRVYRGHYVGGVSTYIGGALQVPSQERTTRPDVSRALETSSTPDRTTGLAHFFVETPKPDWDKLQIVDVVGTDVDTNRDSTRVIIYTNALGDLDPSLRLSNYPSMRMGPVNSSACNGQDIFVFNLALSDKHWEIATDGSAKVLEGPLAWRVENISYEPFISLDAAIRYVIQRRDKTTDPLLKENASATLAVLTFFKLHIFEDLPPVLIAKAGDPCGGGNAALGLR
jgi:hypothetical protein